MVFDVHFLQALVAYGKDSIGSEEDELLLKKIESTLLETVDPVDWTLAESYMKSSMEEFISSMALLLSPLLSSNYQLEKSRTMKALSKNANVLFTPVEKIASYPIASQSLQLLLQSQLKSVEMGVFCVCSHSRNTRDSQYDLLCQGFLVLEGFIERKNELYDGK